MNNKLLLTTTALATFFVGNAMADAHHHHHQEGLHVKVGGNLDAQAGFRSQSGGHTSDGATPANKIGLSQNNNSVAFDTTPGVYVSVKGRTPEGAGHFHYGARIGVDTTVASNKSLVNHHRNRTYIYMHKNDMGRLELGNNEGVSDSMYIGAANVAAATGGVSGDWWKYLRTTTYKTGETVDARNFALMPGMPLDNTLTFDNSKADSVGHVTDLNKAALFNREKSRKVTYYTPKMSGFQAGISYIPDTANGALAVLPNTNIVNNNLNGVKDALQGGLSWEGNMHKDHMVKVSLVGETGKSKSALFEKTNSVALGAMYTWMNELSLSANYTHLGKSGLAKNTDATKPSPKSGNLITAGVGYKMGKMHTSLTAMLSEKNKNKLTAISLGADYHAAPGFMPYAEVTMMEMKQKRDGGYVVATSAANNNPAQPYATETTAHKNKGTTFILGTKLRF